MSIYTAIMIVAIIKFVILPSLKDRIIPLKKLAIMPMIFIVLFYQSLIENFGIDFLNIGIVVLGLLIGISFGLLIRSNTLIMADKNKNLIWLPKSYVSLVIFPLAFLIHFIIGYLQSTNPNFLIQKNIPHFILLLSLVLISGVTIGMSACLFYKFHTSEDKSLL